MKVRSYRCVILTNSKGLNQTKMRGKTKEIIKNVPNCSDNSAVDFGRSDYFKPT